MSVEQLYHQYIKRLPAADQLRLIAMIAQTLSKPAPAPAARRRSLAEFEGLGADMGAGSDARQYISDLRAEWDHRP